VHLFRGREPFRQACSDNLVRKSRPLVLFFWECACLLAVYYVFFRRYAHVCVCVYSYVSTSVRACTQDWAPLPDLRFLPVRSRAAGSGTRDSGGGGASSDWASPWGGGSTSKAEGGQGCLRRPLRHLRPNV
jgi:hypothetical protein